MAKRGTRVWKDDQVDEVNQQIEEYFQSRWEKRTIKQRQSDGSTTEFEEEYMRPPTMAGLALALGVDRNTLINYAERDEFRIVLTRAKTRIAEFAEEALYTREAATGARFALEVNHRYGREETAQGAEFVQNVIAPAQPGQTVLAVAKWEPGEDFEDV